MSLLGSPPKTMEEMTAKWRRLEELLSQQSSIHGDQLIRSAVKKPSSSYAISSENFTVYNTTLAATWENPNTAGYGLQVTVTTNGNPVLLGLTSKTSGINVGDGACIGMWGSVVAPLSAAVWFRIVRSDNPNPIAIFVLEANMPSAGAIGIISRVPPGSISHIDFPPKGTYTYKFQIYSPSVPATLYALVRNCRFYAIEL